MAAKTNRKSIKLAAPIHRRLKDAAKKRGMKIEALADVAIAEGLKDMAGVTVCAAGWLVACFLLP